MGLQDELFGKTVKVERIVLMGLKRTNQTIVLREVAKMPRSGTLEEIKDGLLDVHVALMDLGIFQAVDVSIDSGNSPDGCIVVIRSRESNLMSLHSGSYVQGTEGTVEMSLNLNNPIGYAEQITFGLEYGTQRTNLCSLTYTIPKPWGHPVIADVRLQQLVTDREPWCSYVERLRGAVFTVTDETGKHALSYELGWRRLSDPSGRASRSTIGQLGDQIKSAFKYSFAHSALDNPTFPRNGWSMRASTEVAGVGLDSNLVRFTKHQVSTQIAMPVGEEAAFHLEGHAGLVLPWGGQETSICDRFFLGGISHDGLRGFKLRGVGPCDARRPLRRERSDDDEPPRPDAVGGDISWSVLAALRFGLPWESLHDAGLRGQLFLNCGNLARLHPARPLNDVMSDFFSKFRCSVGAGIIWPTVIGRLEINVAHVLRRHDTDQVRTGIQFGFTTSF